DTIRFRSGARGPRRASPATVRSRACGSRARRGTGTRGRCPRQFRRPGRRRAGATARRGPRAPSDPRTHRAAWRTTPRTISRRARRGRGVPPCRSLRSRTGFHREVGVGGPFRERPVVYRHVLLAEEREDERVARGGDAPAAIRDHLARRLRSHLSEAAAELLGGQVSTRLRVDGVRRRDVHAAGNAPGPRVAAAYLAGVLFRRERVDDAGVATPNR